MRQKRKIPTLDEPTRGVSPGYVRRWTQRTMTWHPPVKHRPARQKDKRHDPLFLTRTTNEFHAWWRENFEVANCSECGATIGDGKSICSSCANKR